MFTSCTPSSARITLSASFVIIGPAGHPGEVSVMLTSTSPPTTAMSYTRPKSMMFMSSSGSFTCRKAWRTTSAVSAAGAVMEDSFCFMPSSRSLVSGVAPHQTAPLPRNPGVDPPGHGAHPGHQEDGREPPPPQQAQDFRRRVRAGEHTPVGEHEMHRRRERGKRNSEPRNPFAILKRNHLEPVFPVPAQHEVDALPAEPALAVVNQRGPFSAHRTPGRPRRQAGRALFSGL